MKNQPSYITNAQGEKTAVILSLEDYQELLDDAEDLAAIAEITVKKSAKKSLLELPAQIVQNLTAIIDTLAENPRAIALYSTCGENEVIIRILFRRDYVTRSDALFCRASRPAPRNEK